MRGNSKIRGADKLWLASSYFERSSDNFQLPIFRTTDWNSEIEILTGFSFIEIIETLAQGSYACIVESEGQCCCVVWCWRCPNPSPSSSHVRIVVVLSPTAIPSTAHAFRHEGIVDSLKPFTSYSQDATRASNVFERGDTSEECENTTPSILRSLPLSRFLSCKFDSKITSSHFRLITVQSNPNCLFRRFPDSPAWRKEEAVVSWRIYMGGSSTVVLKINTPWDRFSLCGSALLFELFHRIHSSAR